MSVVLRTGSYDVSVIVPYNIHFCVHLFQVENPIFYSVIHHLIVNTIVPYKFKL